MVVQSNHKLEHIVEEWYFNDGVGGTKVFHLGDRGGLFRPNSLKQYLQPFNKLYGPGYRFSDDKELIAYIKHFSRRELQSGSIVDNPNFGGNKSE
jgi:hypothetical protein